MSIATPQKNISLIVDVFLIFLRLGCTSFGGPVAHLGYFYTEFVSKRQWFFESDYASLVGLCQFLPGPTSSQVGIAIGLAKAGYAGALVAWLGFTMPSAFLLILFAYGINYFNGELVTGMLHGLKIVAVAVVAQAIWQMAKSLCPDRITITMAVITVLVLTLFPTVWGQIIVILVGGVLGVFLLKPSSGLSHSQIKINVSHRVASFALILFFALLVLLPIIASLSSNHTIALLNSFYQSGALVFGGGHVVLPLLQSSVVDSGWVNQDAFISGYAAAQAVPGPLFTFAAYLGAVASPEPNGLWGGIICLVAIFLPAFLLVIGVLPFWEKLKHFKSAQSAILGVNATVVGILLFAFYDPIWINTIQRPIDFAYALLVFSLLMFWKLPPWVVILISAAIGILLAVI